MTTASPPPPPAPAPAPEAARTQVEPPTSAGRPRAGRIALIVIGAVTALVACGVLLVGGLALWGNAQKDDAGFLSTGSHPFAADTHAVVSESLNLDLDGAESIFDSGEFGTVRLEAASQSGEPVFVGIAPTSQVSSYLSNVAYTTVTDIDDSPFKASYSRQDGARDPAPPTDQRIWAASTQGSGSQALTWKVEDGDWSIVVMNADGSSGVKADISAGAKVPLLSEIGWGGIIGGTILLAIAATLLVFGIRSPRNRSGTAHTERPAPAAG
jgi:hypothetical protein